MRASKKKWFHDKTPKPADKNKQTINRPTILFETEYFQFEEKTSPTQIRPRDLCRPLHNRYLHAKVAGNAKKFELFMNQDTNDSVKQVVDPEKSLYSSLITLANRKRKYIKIL